MPINLTTVPENDEPIRRRRRRRHSNKQRRHVLFAALAGVGLLLAVVGVIALMNWENKSDSVAAPPVSPPQDPLPRKPLAEEGPKSPMAEPAPAVSSDEMPANLAKSRIAELRQKRGAQNNDVLELRYEFFEMAGPPSNYRIAVKTPGGFGYVGLNPEAPRIDTVEFSLAKNNLGLQRPIKVWIETVHPSDNRVSNVMTLP